MALLMRHRGFSRSGNAAGVGLVAAWVVLLFSVGVAFATYTIFGSGTSQTAAQKIGAANAPQVGVTNNDVTLTWAPISLSGGTSVGGYVIRRYSTGGFTQTVGSACTTSFTGLGVTTCVEHGVPDGVWHYTVQAVKGAWSGGESGTGTAVVAVPPRLVSATAYDTNGNGKIDEVDVLFDDTLALPYSAANTGWTLVGVPSGGSLSSVAVSGSSATLSLTEGSGTVSTSTSGFTVALAATSGGIRDSYGNLSSSAATSISDHVGPIATAISDMNGSTDGRFQSGDTVTFTFSEPVLGASVPAMASVALATNGTTNTLSIPGITNGAMSLGGNKYLSGASGSATFANSSVVVSGASITVTLGAVCTGSCASIGTQNPATGFAYLPAATITDAAGNGAQQAVKSVSIRLF